MLSRDQSIFVDMFRFSSGPNSTLQNSTDEDPLILRGDTANQFRALCWVLHAL